MTSFGGGDGADTRNANVTLSADVSPYTANVAQADQATRSLANNIDALSAKMSALNRGAQGKLMGFAKADMAGMAGATALAATFENQLKTLRATASVTGQSFDSMKRHIEGVFTSLPVARGEVVQMTQALSQLGVQGGVNLGKLATTYEKLGAATGEFAISLGQSMTQLNRLMTNAGPIGAGEFANTLLVLSKNAGVSAQAVADFSNSIAPMGRVMGLSEKQVMGLSTSFVKAGSDGFVAANLFNSMADEISQATQTGSPAILKYANLLGLTAKQFTNLPGAQKITDLVDAISKGGPAAQQFAQAMGLGPRQMASLTALAQSGDLAKNMQTAMGTSGTKELENASKAAFGGLSDQLVNFRNEMTQAGTAVGTTFLTPVTLAMKGVNGLASSVGGLVSTFSGLIGAGMAVAAPVAGLGALALHVAGIVGALALGRLALRSTGMASFGLGRQLAQGTPLAQMTEAQQRAAAAQAAGTMRPWQQRLVGAGQSAQAASQRIFGPGGMPTSATLGQVFKGALIAGPRVGTWMMNDTMRLFSTAMQNDFQRQGLTWSSGGLGAAWRNLTAQAQQPGSVGANTRTMLGTGRAYLGSILGTGLRMGTQATSAVLSQFGAPHPIQAYQAAAQQADTARLAAGKSITSFGAQLNRATSGLGAFTSNMLKATAVTGARMGVSAVGGAIGGVGRLAGAALGAVFSPWGMAAMIGGSYVANRIQESKQKLTDIKESDYWMQPVKQYNDQLGIATKNLSSFNDGLAANTEVTRALGHVTVNSPMWQAARFTSADQVADASMKVTDTNLTNLKEMGGKTSDLVAYFLSLGLQDPRTLKLAGAQAIGAGFSAEQVSKAAGAAARQSVTGGLLGSPAALAPAITRGTQGLGWYGQMMDAFTSGKGIGALTSPHSTVHSAISSIPVIGQAFDVASWLINKTMPGESPKALGIRGTAESMIQNRFDISSEQYNQHYAAQQKLIDTTQTLSALMQAGGRSVDEAAKMAADEWGGAESDWKGALKQAADTAKSGKTGMEQAIVDSMSTLKVGQLQIGALRDQGVTTNVADFASNLDKLKSGVTDAVTRNLINQGPGGQWVATSPLFKAATAGPSSDQTRTIFAAVQGTADAQTRLASSTDRTGSGLDTMTVKLLGASAALDKIMASGMDPTGRGFAIASAARTEVQQRLAAHVMTLPRAQLDQARAAAMAHGAPQTARDDYAAQQQNWTQIQEGERQHLIAMIQLVHGYNLQRARMQEDYNYSVRQSNIAFNTDLAHADLQFQQQQARTHYEFNLQMERSDYEFHLQMSRSNAEFYLQQRRAKEEFDIQMQRSTAAQVQSAFNPYERIQAQFTLDAGTVDQNVREATQMMRRQLRQVRELQRMGISQDTIDALHLADPANFQATDNFYETVKAFPKMVGRINRDVRRETQAGTALIQSPLNVDYRHALEDYERHSRQAVADLTRHNRQALADLNRHNRQALEDFARHNQQLVHDFNQSRQWAIEAHQREMDQMAHAFHNSLDRMHQDVSYQLKEFTGSYKNLMGIFRGEIKAGAESLGKAGDQLATKLEAENRIIDRQVRHAERQAARLQNIANTAAASGQLAITTPQTIGVNPSGAIGYYTSEGRFVATPNAPISTSTPPSIAPPRVSSGQGAASTSLSRHERRQLHDPSQYGRVHRAGVVGINPEGYLGHYTRGGRFVGDVGPYAPHSLPNIGPPRGHQSGGVSLHEHTASISEGNRAEMIVPLQSSQGVAAVSEMYRSVSRQLVQQLQTAGRGRDHTGSGGMSVTNNNYDHSTDVSGPVTVVASSPEEMLRALQQKQKLARLTSPVHARSR